MDEDYKYLLIWLAAVIFTFLEVYLIGYTLAFIILILAILGFAFVKAVLIAGYFQHLFYEKRILGIWYFLTILTLIALVITWVTGR